MSKAPLVWKLAILVFVLLTAAAVQAQDFSGEWYGNASGNLPCPSGGSVTQTFTVYLGAAQSGSDLTVVAVMIGPNDACVAGSPIIVIGPIFGTGTVSGNSFSVAGQMQSPGGPVNGHISGTLTNASTMQVMISADNGFSISGTVGLNAIPSDLSGSYGGPMSGSKDYTDRNCPDVKVLTFSGGASVTLQQSGTNVTGTFISTGEKDLNGCTPADKGTVTGTLSGTISGFTLSGTASTSGGSNPFFGTVGGNALTIVVQIDRGSIVMNLTKGGTPPPPGGSGVLAFSATPPTIRAGQSATLTWSAPGATSVTIDNGIGAVATSGSKSVTPPATTTYTLTATQGTQSKTISATVEVLSGPIVNVTSLPNAMIEPAGIGGATTSYALTNSGSEPASLTLTQNGDFFTQSPASFTIAPGATQVVTITASAQPAGSYEGASVISGSLQVPVKLLVAAPPAGTVTATPPAPRVDVAAPVGDSPTGSVSFTNNGNATLTGILTADVPWIIPPTGFVTIPPGSTGTFTFVIDRSKRPDTASAIGSVEGSIALSFLTGSGSSFAKRAYDGTSSAPSVSTVKVVDTAKPAVSTAGIPALGTNEVALFIPGVGHATGTTGVQFASDVNFLNPLGGKSITDLKLYYTSTGGDTSKSQTASLGTVATQSNVAVADVVKSVFSGNDEVGTLQVRSADADKLAVAATVLTTNNPSGTFGNTIPVFRSDRAAATGSAVVLTGLRKDSSTHTNLYIQETSGSTANVTIDYLAADGSTIKSDSKSIDGFKLMQLVDAVPQNAVAAFITNTSTGTGRIAAYATPLDEKSSDTWAISDWAQQFGYAPTEATVVPIAGDVHGANNTFYRTDLAITNRGTSQATGTLRYLSRTGDKIDKPITLGAKQTIVLSDIVGTFFNVSGDSMGFLTFTPGTGSVAISSRTFTTAGSNPATFGTGVPTVAASSAVRNGGSKPIAGLSDAARQTVVAARPGTYRTNFALMETTGSRATVRVTFRFTFPAGQKAQGVGSASRDYVLNGNGFVMLNSIAGEVLGPARMQFGDLSNVEADFQVVSGDGGVMLFTSSVDNATGDSTLRTE